MGPVYGKFNRLRTDQQKQQRANQVCVLNSVQGGFEFRKHRTLIGLLYLQQAEQLKALKKHYEDEIEAHEREINRHTESINRLKRRRSEISKAASNADIDSMVGLRIDS